MRDRGTLVVSIALCGGLAIGSYWFAQQARLSDPVPRALGHEIDYSAKDITLTRMDKTTGLALYTIDATSLVHYYDDDTGDLTEPRIVGSKRGRPEMRIRAERGHTTADGEEVRLYGNVVVNRAAFATAPPMIAKSEYMLAHPDREVVETDQPVEIIRGGSNVHATGMQYDNVTQQTRFGGTDSARMRTEIAPRSIRSAPSP
jgi:lipopolysaccharide export system protein LptC